MSVDEYSSKNDAMISKLNYLTKFLFVRIGVFGYGIFIWHYFNGEWRVGEKKGRFFHSPEKTKSELVTNRGFDQFHYALLVG